MTNQVIGPKPFIDMNGPLLPPLSEEIIDKIVQEQLGKTHDALPIMKSYTQNLSNDMVADHLGQVYQTWSLRCEVKTMSSHTHNQDTITDYVGRGKKPKIQT